MLSPKQIKDMLSKAPAGAYNLEKVTTSVPIRSGTERDPAGATAKPSGPVVLNTEATDWWNSLVHNAGYDRSAVGAAFEADGEQHLVAVRPSLGPDDSLMPVRWLSNGLVSIHLGGCYREKPQIRPERRGDVHISLGPDSEGNACLYIHLKVALAKPVRKRVAGAKKKDQTPTSAGETAAAGQQTPDAESEAQYRPLLPHTQTDQHEHGLTAAHL